MCVCGGGYSGIFIYICRLGPFLGVLEFQNFFFFFGGGVQKYHYFRGYEDFVDISLQNWTGFMGHFYTFQGFFLRSMCRMGIFWGSPKLQIFFWVWLIFPIYFGGRQ